MIYKKRQLGKKFHIALNKHRNSNGNSLANNLIKI